MEKQASIVLRELGFQRRAFVSVELRSKIDGGFFARHQSELLKPAKQSGTTYTEQSCGVSLVSFCRLHRTINQFAFHFQQERVELDGLVLAPRMCSRGDHRANSSWQVGLANPYR